MEEIIKTIEVDRWSEPDENRRVKHLGMIKAKDAFDALYAHLQEKNMLPDEYFLFSRDAFSDGQELPNYASAICHTDFGGSEGIYIDIMLRYENQKYAHFATGKTLSDDADAFFMMSRIAAECSLMLNGRGAEMVKHNVEAVFTPEESLALGAVIEKKLCEYNEPEQDDMLMRLFEKAYPFSDRDGMTEPVNEPDNDMEI